MTREELRDEHRRNTMTPEQKIARLRAIADWASKTGARKGDVELSAFAASCRARIIELRRTP